MSPRQTAILKFPNLDLSELSVIDTIEWSPSGNHIAFSLRESIYLVDVRTGEAERKTFGTWTNRQVIKWSINGKEFLHSSNGEIYCSNIERNEPILIGRGHSYRWTPDYSEIMYSNDRGHFISNLNGDFRSIPRKEGLLSFSGTKLLTSNNRFLTEMKIVNMVDSESMDVDSTLNSLQWGWGGAWADDVFWSKNDNYIYFTQGGYWNRFFVFDISTPACFLIEKASSPRLSPDSTRFVFVDNAISPQTLAVSQLDGNGRKIIVDLGVGERPSMYAYDWSPSSDQIAYAVGHEIRFISL